jgi:hypothetical protein
MRCYVVLCCVMLRRWNIFTPLDKSNKKLSSSRYDLWRIFSPFRLLQERNSVWRAVQECQNHKITLMVKDKEREKERKNWNHKPLWQRSITQARHLNLNLDLTIRKLSFMTDFSLLDHHQIVSNTHENRRKIENLNQFNKSLSTMSSQLKSLKLGNENDSLLFCQISNCNFKGQIHNS